MDLYFERITDNDFKTFYILKCDDENVFWTGHIKVPDKNTLKTWFMKQLLRKDRIIFLAKSKEYPNDALGYLYLDVVGENNDHIETGHGVHSKFAGHGIGTMLIKHAIDYSTNHLRMLIIK